MPGVPTGRGCDACRKQKKKCIFDEANPVCSRCARLKLECIGRGTQRYIFKTETGSLKSKSTSRATSKTSSPASQQNGSVKSESRTTSRETSTFSSNCPTENDIDFAANPISLAKPPTNQVTALTQSFLSAMGPQVDLRYNLVWTYGGFMSMIPQRLGVNEALDTAVDALVASHLAIACGNGVGVDALAKNARALSVLRRSLGDPVEASASETLCAVCLLMIVQSIHDPSQHKRSGHAEGAAKILQARRIIKPQNDFDALLLLSLRGIVVFEGIFNPNINLTPEEWKDLVESDIDTAFFQEGKMLYCLSRVPTILARARSLNLDLASDTNSRDKETKTALDSIQRELEGLYTTTRSICDEFRARLAELEEPGALYAVAALAPLKIQPEMLHAHSQRMYVYVMVISLYLNYILVSVYSTIGTSNFQSDSPIKTETKSEAESPSEIDRTTSLRADAIHDANEILTIAENAIMYRPFGAALVPWGLLAARMAIGLNPDSSAGYEPGESDLSLKEALERSYWDYQGDFNGTGTGHDIEDLEKTFAALRPFDVAVRF